MPRLSRWLARTEGVDSTRIGIYGVSYGGFMTLMSLFRYPGVFAAGISAAGVTDWAHYSDSWTSRILNRPHDDPDAYRLSSPIYHAERLSDLSHQLGVATADQNVAKLARLGADYEETQTRLLGLLEPFWAPGELKLKRSKSLKPAEPTHEMLELVASLERVPVERRKQPREASRT